ncbi:MAG: branched-chain amino acid aminotransferase [Rhodospirillales bacterium]|nr:branched-chain amino acid aminotransferase [Rhodospirillales bacterium]
MATAPFDDRDGSVWFDGKLIPWRDGKVHFLTHALHYGSGVFEGMRAYDGEIFKLDEHNRRLINSAGILGFEIPYSLDEINQACRDALAAEGLSDAYVRPIAWRGSEMMGVAAQDATIHLAIACWAWPSYFSPDALLKGLRLNISDWRRPAPDTAPTNAKATGLYMICTLSKHKADAEGCDDSLMLDYRGLVAEATGANIFFLKDGALHTPTPDCFLDGITRRTVIGLARARGIEVIERAIKPEEMADFEQAFLTGTAAEVSPLREIGPYTFVVGDVTKALMDDYQKIVRRKVAA